MRIAILTLSIYANYGGILQAYALQRVLQQMGHEVVVIRHDNKIPYLFFRDLIWFGVYLIRRFILRRNVQYVSLKRLLKDASLREQYTKPFIDNNISLFNVRHIEKDLPKIFDAIVVGSDQVWRRGYFTDSFGSSIEHAFLKFAEGWQIKRIAYAASFGTDEWEYSEEETKECARLLQLFNKVSVREDSAVLLCKEKLGRSDVQHLLDPTFLLPKEDYISIVNRANVPKSKGTLMCYILDKNSDKIAIVDKIAKERNLVPFYTNSQIDNVNLPNCERIQPPLEQWLRGFMDAEFVITDSFHACVFSIIFGKPFVVIGNKERGMARFSSLLKMFSLEDHLISSIDDYEADSTYEVPSSSIEILRDKIEISRSFLKNL